MKSSTLSQNPGAILKENTTEFCFYCPKAESVSCILFDSYNEPHGEEHSMEKASDGYWVLTVEENLSGKWYGYRAEFDSDSYSNNSPYLNFIFADPYSKHLTVTNTYRQDARSYIYNDEFDWQGDQHCFPDDPRDLIIYETHLKDLTAHPSSKAKGNGSYQKFIDPQQRGGLPYLKSLGVNCIEFLPLHKFPRQEPPYGQKTEEGFHNTWNIYAQNYWGYMTSFFFAPESSFASDRSLHYSGKTPAAVSEFKNMVKAIHKEDISVIMDVVYNHTSLFDANPLTHLCPDEYLRADEKGKFLNRSGTGNEFRSENPVVRQLIIDSLLYWIEEYHIDGFRFDLAALLDKKTWDKIKKEVHKKYPKVVLIAEPWGGHYAPHQFSEHGWASWNDRIRNSIKGSDPLHDRGFIFSDWHHETRRERLENIFRGTLNHGEGGLFLTSAHSVNYLESHDGYTLGDFIRIGLNPEINDTVVTPDRDHYTLNETEMKISKLAALSLFTAQGLTMIHEGQEFGRSKVIAKDPCGDPETGKIDHNSYQKDNETNWINFEHKDLNRSLYDYYRGLISIRKNAPALRKNDPDEMAFDYFGDPLLISFCVSGKTIQDLYDYYIILNGNSGIDNEIKLPAGTWELLADKNIASSQPIDILSGNIIVPAQTGMLLRKLRH